MSSPPPPRTGQLVAEYFRVKRRQLLAAADLPTAAHTGLAGSHREEIHRIYLREILPTRFAVGRGIVYGIAHRSRESDVVIWDAANFPSLPMLDHNFFFAEAVRVILESKSRWSAKQFADVLEKARAVRDIVSMSGPNLADQLDMIRLDLASLRSGRPHEGLLIAKHHIGTAAVFLKGGRNSLKAADITDDILADADDSWPDLVLLLEPGRLIVKEYQDQAGALFFYELGEDALLAFTNGLLALLAERSVQAEYPLFLTNYAFEIADIPPVDALPFRYTRPPASRVPLWTHVPD